MCSPHVDAWFHLDWLCYLVFNIPWSVLHRGLDHVTTADSTKGSKIGPPDERVHFRVHVPEDMETSNTRFKAYTFHVYWNGEIPQATYDPFSLSRLEEEGIKLGKRRQSYLEKQFVVDCQGRRPLPSVATWT